MLSRRRRKSRLSRDLSRENAKPAVKFTASRLRGLRMHLGFHKWHISVFWGYCIFQKTYKRNFLYLSNCRPIL